MSLFPVYFFERITLKIQFNKPEQLFKLLLVIFYTYMYLSLSYLFYCRYLTVLFYLSSIEEGGDTTFPVADNRTYDEKVSVLPQSTIISQQGLLPL